ncbi:hypothetical protein J6590_007469 [Homalodisca vitripennis]|nr:hypothetical protein J6590_007469 [Homalodisca vitripennis]
MLGNTEKRSYCEVFWARQENFHFTCNEVRGELLTKREYDFHIAGCRCRVSVPAIAARCRVVAFVSAVLIKYASVCLPVLTQSLLGISSNWRTLLVLINSPSTYQLSQYLSTLLVLINSPSTYQLSQYLSTLPVLINSPSTYQLS